MIGGYFGVSKDVSDIENFVRTYHTCALHFRALFSCELKGLLS